MHRFPLLSLAAVLSLAVGCAAALGGGKEPAAAVSQPLPADPSGRSRAGLGALRLDGGFVLSGQGIGGLSGLALLSDGQSFVSVSDRGSLVSGRFVEDAGGHLSGATGVQRRRLPLDDPPPDLRGRDRPRPTDAEEVTAAPDGGWLVSFERDHRIVRYPADFAAHSAAGSAVDGRRKPVRLPTPPGFADAPDNGGAEAMTLIGDERILVLEEGEDDGRARRGWIGRFEAGGGVAWRTLAYRAAPGFRPSGATRLPDGDVLVLERRVSWFAGWSARIVRIDAAALSEETLALEGGPGGAELCGTELGRIEGGPLADNYEGIAAWPAPGGGVWIYLVSDDNLSSLQSTFVLRLRLEPSALTPRPDRPAAGVPRP